MAEGDGDAMIKTKKNSNNTIIPIIIGIIGGFWLHSIYNISLQYNLSYISIPTIILAFFLMTYLSFQSDILYKQQPTETINNTPQQ